MPQGPGRNFRYQPQMAALLAEARSAFAPELERRPELDGLLDLMERGIVDRDRSLEDFLTGLPPAPAMYDCYVDPTRSADDVANRTFTTVASAVNTMRPLGFATLLRIGFFPNHDLATAATDAAAVTTWPTVLIIEAIGGPAVPSNSPAMATQAFRWNMNAQSHTAPTQMICKGLRITSGGAAGTNWWPGGGTGNTHTYFDCYLDGQAATTSNATQPTRFSSAGTLFARNTYFLDVAASNGQVTLFDCAIFNSISRAATWGDASLNSRFTALNCIFTGTNTNVTNFCTLTLQYDRITIFGAHDDFTTSSAYTVPYIFKPVPGTNGSVTIDAHSWNNTGGNTGYSIDTTGVGSTTKVTVNATGSFVDVKLGAPLAQHRHLVSAFVGGNLDVTGPAHVDVQAESPVTLRGVGIDGVLGVSVNGNLTAISYVGASRTSVIASIGSPAGGTTEKSYAFDATSTRNVLIITGTDQYPTAGTDAGTNNRVITELGSAGLDATAIHTGDAAGGDLAGTFPNPTVDGLQGRPVAGAAPAGSDVLTWDAVGVTWKPAAAASAPEGAGAGTYGNIGVAARVTLDANGHTTAAANVIDFSQSFLTMGP